MNIYKGCKEFFNSQACVLAALLLLMTVIAGQAQTVLTADQLQNGQAVELDKLVWHGQERPETIGFDSWAGRGGDQLSDLVTLRADVVNLVIGALLLALGLASLMLCVLRWEAGYSFLSFFGFFCGLYGFRLSANTKLLQFIIPLPESFWRYQSAFTTYLILIPVCLLAESYLGPGWRGSLRLIRQIQCAYAIGAIIIDSLAEPSTAMSPNSFLVILWLVMITVNGLWVWRRQSAPLSRESRILLGGAGFFALTAINNNLIDYRLVPWRLSIEPIGMLIFVLGLGYFIAHRYFANERALFAVTVEHQRQARELEEARQLQLSMLPKKLPSLPHLDIAAYMKTASEVGGDYYDFHVGEDGTLTIAVGDATGHGLKAGTLVASVKSLFVSLAYHPDIPHILHRISAVLKEMKLRGLFMAMTMVKVKGHQMSVSIAGMPSVLIYRAQTGAVEEIVMRALPLGGMTKYQYQQKELTLAVNDVVVLMSDGLPERFNPHGEMLEEQATKQCLAQHAQASAQKIIEGLAKLGDDWGGARPQDDDITFVVLKLK